MPLSKYSTFTHGMPWQGDMKNYMQQVQDETQDPTRTRLLSSTPPRPSESPIVHRVPGVVSKDTLIPPGLMENLWGGWTDVWEDPEQLGEGVETV